MCSQKRTSEIIFIAALLIVVPNWTNRVLPRKCTGHSKHLLPTTQEKTLQMDNTEIRLIIFFAAKDGEALYSHQKQDQELTVAQIMHLLITNFRLKWKKVGKIARAFRYDLNHIPYDYTVEVRNRFQGLDLIDKMPDELWSEVRDIVQETGIRSSPWKRKAKKQNGCLGRPYK